MIRRHARRAVVRLVAGFLVMALAALVWMFAPLPEDPDDWGPPLMLLYAGGAALYIWGCACLAEAKGHSTAIILVAFLSCIPGAFWLPLLLLLVLPDKNAHESKRHRHHHHDD